MPQPFSCNFGIKKFKLECKDKNDKNDAADNTNYIQILPASAGSNSLMFGVRDGGTAKAYFTGNGRIIKTGAATTNYTDVLNQGESDALYAKLHSPSVGNLKELFTLPSHQMGNYLYYDHHYLAEYAASGITNYVDVYNVLGDFVAQNHATADNGLVSSYNYRFCYYMVTRDNANVTIKRRRGITNGSALASQMGTDSLGYAYGAPVAGSWDPGSSYKHYVSGWYQMEDR